MLATDGSYTYTLNNADPAVNALPVGGLLTDTFTYTAKDVNATTATAALVITINGSNDNPLATVNSYTTDEDTAKTGNVITDDTGSGADSDVDTGDTFSVTQVNGSATLGVPIVLPSGAALTVNNECNSNYDPSTSATLNALPVGSSTTDSFDYTLGDNHGRTDTATVTFTINGVNDAPTVTQSGGGSTYTEGGAPTV